ncbi:hypothetical protein ACFLY6_02960 [Candidatus Dependentiae bacterium]
MRKISIIALALSIALANAPSNAKGPQKRVRRPKTFKTAVISKRKKPSYEFSTSLGAFSQNGQGELKGELRYSKNMNTLAKIYSMGSDNATQLVPFVNGFYAQGEIVTSANIGTEKWWQLSPFASVKASGVYKKGFGDFYAGTSTVLTGLVRRVNKINTHVEGSFLGLFAGYGLTTKKGSFVDAHIELNAQMRNTKFGENSKISAKPAFTKKLIAKAEVSGGTELYKNLGGFFKANYGITALGAGSELLMQVPAYVQSQAFGDESDSINIDLGEEMVEKSIPFSLHRLSALAGLSYTLDNVLVKLGVEGLMPNVAMVTWNTNTDDDNNVIYGSVNTNKVQANLLVDVEYSAKNDEGRGAVYSMGFSSKSGINAKVGFSF